MSTFNNLNSDNFISTVKIAKKLSQVIQVTLCIYRYHLFNFELHIFLRYGFFTTLELISIKFLLITCINQF